MILASRLHNEKERPEQRLLVHCGGRKEESCVCQNLKPDVLMM